MARKLPKKVVKAGFWTFLGYTALSTTLAWTSHVGLIPAGKKVDSTPVQQTQEETSISYLAEKSFTQQFVREYLFWTQGKEQSRADRLKKFFLEGMDPQGGWNFKESTWDSYTRNVDIWSIQADPEDPKRYEIVAFAETIMTNVKDPKIQKRVDRFLHLDIKKAGDSFYVMSTPIFLPEPVPAPLEKDEKSEEKGSAVDSSTKDTIENFMKSFWKVYTTDTPQEINYFYRSDKPIAGLTGIVGFVELKNLSVKDMDKYYQVDSDVVLQDLASESTVVQKYRFHVIQEGERYYVIHMSPRKE